MKKTYRFTFADGYECWCYGMSKTELAAEVRKHGKLVAKTLA